MWQAGSVVHKENRIDGVGSSRPQNPTTTSPSRHTWHYATFVTPSGLGGRGAMALGDGAARDLPARVYYTHTHSTPSTPAVVARALPPRTASSSITLGWPTDVILALALAISHPPVARPHFTSMLCMRAWIYECEFPCQTKITALRPPRLFIFYRERTMLFLLLFHNKIYSTPRHWNEFMISSLYFFRLLFMT